MIDLKALGVAPGEPVILAIHQSQFSPEYEWRQTANTVFWALSRNGSSGHLFTFRTALICGPMAFTPKLHGINLPYIVGHGASRFDCVAPIVRDITAWAELRQIGPLETRRVIVVTNGVLRDGIDTDGTIAGHPVSFIITDDYDQSEGKPDFSTFPDPKIKLTRLSTPLKINPETFSWIFSTGFRKGIDSKYSALMMHLISLLPQGLYSRLITGILAALGPEVPSWRHLRQSILMGTEQTAQLLNAEYQTGAISENQKTLWSRWFNIMICALEETPLADWESLYGWLVECSKEG